MMQIRIFYNSNPEALDEEIGKWLEQFDGETKAIKIHHIKQTALPPNRVAINPATLDYRDQIEHESDIVISVWFDEIKKNITRKKRPKPGKMMTRGFGIE